jgi:predicted ATPase
VEAISHLTKGLELLKTLPDSLERAQQELALQATLGITLTVTKGYAAPEVERARARALELCRQVGETPQLFPVLFGLYAFHLLRAELHTARELAEQLLRLAQSLQDPALLIWPHDGLGLTSCQLGELTSARAHLEQSIALYDPQKHRPDRSQVSMQDPKVTCLSYAAWVLWHLGYPDQARKRIAEALTLARELSHPFSLAFALTFAAMLNQLLRDVRAVQERTEALRTLAREQGFPYWLASETIRQGWVLAEQGQGKEGIAQMRQGMAAMRATGAELNRSWDLARLTEAYGKAGQVEEGLTLLAEALAFVDKTGERLYEAELYRLRGELTLQSQASLEQVSDKSQAGQDKSENTNPQPLTPNPRAEAEAEACFHKAIEISRKQQAKSLELRAAVSLSRLWQQQGKQKEAHDMLAELYGWFTEGFDTKDLQEAETLLAELQGAVPKEAR